MPPNPPQTSFWDRPLTGRQQSVLVVGALVLMLATFRGVLGRWDHVGLLIGPLAVFVTVRVLAQRVCRARGWQVPAVLARLAVIALGAGVGVLAAFLSLDAFSLRAGLWYGAACGAASALNDTLQRSVPRPSA